MDAFKVHRRLIDDYRSFTTSAVDIRDPKIAEHVQREQAKGRQWPDPWLSLTPMFAPAGTVEELADPSCAVLHPDTATIFRRRTPENAEGTSLLLHQHQRDAIDLAQQGKSYVLTTGTGSGKSMGYIMPIVNHVLRNPEPQQTTAIIVYPMNALANSQVEELKRYLDAGAAAGARQVTHALYTGQESQERRDEILQRIKPDILLTNFVMLELMLTRPEERRRLLALLGGLKFLVLDELHTYRGRQGADVALLVRRLKQAAGASDLQLIGTSATMASGTLRNQQKEVAALATRIFGTPLGPDQVIVETLTRATPERDLDKADLTSVVDGETPPESYADFLAHPFAAWLEETFGLTRDESDPDRLVRRKPTTVRAAAQRLAVATERPRALCEEAIQRWLQSGTALGDLATGRKALAFRLHQFLSKGDTVYASLEGPDERFLTTNYQVMVPGDQHKVLVPLSFCRECGQDYAVVARWSKDGDTRYTGRRESEVDGGQAEEGYLLFARWNDDVAWPTEAKAQRERLPDSWLEEDDRHGTRVRSSRRKSLPQPVYVAPDGLQVQQGDSDGRRATFLPGRFRFCLRCGVSHESARQNDFGKLASLDAEGRSSAATIMATSILRSLRSAEVDLTEPERKLLTFVDNRQDASLQAGHFTDFVMVSLTRAALYQAMEDADKEGTEITHENLAAKVAQALGLQFHDYARGTRPQMRQRRDAERALRHVMEYRVFQDLMWGWRVTMPNLEQTGLLRLEYMSLDELAADDECWMSATEVSAGMPTDRWAAASAALAGLTAQDRSVIAETLLNLMRRYLAVQAACLTDEGHEQTMTLCANRLKEPWALPVNDQRPNPGIAWAGRQSGRYRGRLDWFVSARGGYGLWLRKFFPQLDTEQRQDVIRRLFVALEEAELVKCVGEEQGLRGYRIDAGSLIWRKGDGEEPAPDPTRRNTKDGGRVNPYFRDFYRQTARELAGLYAREHTAQVIAEDRRKREEAFRKGDLKLMYCSPTMELGVDIADLSTVAMRNVPPSPANYAQRSGRAGRAGQASLAVTYCATGNSHDQYYFRRSSQMVAGKVEPPRLDLGNEELIRAHIHAVWLGATSDSLGRTLTSLVDTDNPTLPIKPDIWEQLCSAEARERALVLGQQLVDSVGNEVYEALWYRSDWVQRVVDRAPNEFDAALGRWREMYATALLDQTVQLAATNDPNATARARRVAKSRLDELIQQLSLLRNDASDHYQSDFYPYRYFAAQGFLPGYAFPRLPLAAYIPGVRGSVRNRDDGDYVHRPRFLAITEFGPRALIYHEGYRYEVHRIQLPTTSSPEARVQTEEARTCGTCGYHHDRRPDGAEMCESCGARLPAEPEKNLLRLSSVTTRRRERISSDEEERQKAGFEVQLSYRFTGPRLEAEAVTPDGTAVAELCYGDAATVRITNVGHRRRRPGQRGFFLDPLTRTWLRNQEADDASDIDEAVPDAADEQQSKAKQLVVPYVQDTRNVLVVKPEQELSRRQLITLQYALERGIERRFRLEDSELDSYLLPDTDRPSRILFVESAEGGAGSLKQLVQQPHLIGEVAQEALSIAHFTSTGQDLHRAPLSDDQQELLDSGEEDQEGPDPCEWACYDCLLSFSNQHWHHEINRHETVDLLVDLGAAQVAGMDASEEQEHVRLLLQAADTPSEKRFIQWLYNNGYRLPHTAQAYLNDARVRPDFVYQPTTAVFLDGPVHERPSVQERDLAAEDRLDDIGWAVIRVSAEESTWAEAVARAPEIFGPAGERPRPPLNDTPAEGMDTPGEPR